MERITYNIIFTQGGDYTYSAYDVPVKEYNPETDDEMLLQKHSQLWSWDDFRTDLVPKYEVRETDLPEWLPISFYISRGWYSPQQWRSVFDAPDFETAKWLLTLDMYARPKIIQLLNTKKFRSEFRKSLRSQIVEWLETEPDKRKYESPLSMRQWQALLRY